jgi:hypothetical protein
MWFCDHPACLRQSLTSPVSTNRPRKLLRSKACRTMDSLAGPVMVWLRLRAWDSSPLSTLRLASSLQLHAKGFFVGRIMFCPIRGFYWPSHFSSVSCEASKTRNLLLSPWSISDSTSRSSLLTSPATTIARPRTSRSFSVCAERGAGRDESEGGASVRG